MIKCGVAEVVITPRLGINIPGYFEQRISEDIIDDLMAKAVVFDDGDKFAGILVLDVLHVTRQIVAKIRARITDLTGLDASNIIVAGTHCHTSFAVDTEGHDFANADWKDLDHVCNRSADCVIMAYKHRKEVKLSFARCEEREISFNRRWWMKDGKVHTWPGICNPDNVKPAADIDPEVDIVRIDDLDGNTIGIITSFANHLDVVGGKKYCSDFPGELSRCIKNALGDNVVSIFMNGCCGDVTHIDYTGRFPLIKDQYIAIGRKLAKDVLSLYGKTEKLDATTINVASKTISIARRQFTEEAYIEAKKTVAEIEEKMKTSARVDQSDDGTKPTTGDMNVMALSFAHSTINYYEHPIFAEDIELQAIRVGDLAFSSMPGEMLCEIGLDLKKRSPFNKNIIVELANGCNGYIATTHAFAEGGYETELDYYTNLTETANETINDTLIELLEKL